MSAKKPQQPPASEPKPHAPPPPPPKQLKAIGGKERRMSVQRYTGTHQLAEENHNLAKQLLLMRNERDKLQAENERLRAALQKCLATLFSATD